MGDNQKVRQYSDEYQEDMDLIGHLEVSLDMIHEHIGYIEDDFRHPRNIESIKKIKKQVSDLLDELGSLEGQFIKQLYTDTEEFIGYSFQPPKETYSLTGSKAPLIEQRGKKYRR
ncbi:hypothetical protein [Pseudalkalibacillus caeni]|uniref:Uncharacterized protein n=1 Tax=Exobacillus caeni TaxID=2574798 RepID=A0A5R9F8L8_9BACL|nr:hypothetical protein [Pseudalkalibacillus caeni]TLS38590.1 hypothetical protein FCL54_03570 [Pseudalkalibacillus caeni]